MKKKDQEKKSQDSAKQRHCKECGGEIGKRVQRCGPCRSELRKAQSSTQYIKANPERHCKECGCDVGKSKQRCEQCRIEVKKEKGAASGRKRYAANPEKCAEYGHKYHKANKEKIAEYGRKYRAANKEKIAERNRKYSADPANAEKRHAYRRERRKTDPAYAIQCNLSTRLGDIMRGVGVAKPASTMKIVGCTREELIAHLASKFKPGMTMDNQGSYWHVDHIMPCAAFDHNIPAQVRTCWHYTNLQPLEAKENMSKGCKITEPQMSLPLSPKKDLEK